MPKGRRRRCSLDVISKNISHTHYPPLRLLWKHQKACLWLPGNRGTLPPTSLFFLVNAPLGPWIILFLNPSPPHMLPTSCFCLSNTSLHFRLLVPLIQTSLASHLNPCKNVCRSDSKMTVSSILTQNPTMVKSCFSHFYRKFLKSK